MAQPQLTAAQIITAFELQVNDMTELSGAEELSLLNRIYQKICSLRPWEFLKKQASGTVLTDGTGSYITVPSDFAYFAENNMATENTFNVSNNAAPKVIYIIQNSSYQPYQIINYSDRRQYYQRSGFAYLDTTNSVIRFTMPPVGTTYEFDYIKVPPLLTSSDYPIFPGQFHPVLQFGMAVDNEILQLSPKATSYAKENNAKYESYISDMEYYNANLLLN